MADEVNIGELWIEFSQTAGLTEMRQELDMHKRELVRLNGIANRMLASAKRCIAIYATYETLNATIINAVKKASEREKDLLRLEAVLTAHGIHGRRVVNIYQDMAKSISERTMYTTTQAMRAEEILTTMGIAPGLMQEAIEASVSLTSRTGSLESSAQMIGQAIEGNMKSIGKLVVALRGAKDASPETIFRVIRETYGDISQREIEGYVGEKQKLQKVYDALMLKTGRVLEPVMYRIVRYINKNPNVIANLANPAGLVQAIMQSMEEPEWTWSIGRHRDDKILLDADKQFRKIQIEKQAKTAKKEIDLRDLWIKAMAEQYADAEEANEKWFAEQKAHAETKAKEEYDLSIKNSEYERQLEKSNAELYVKYKSELIGLLNTLEFKVLQKEAAAVYRAFSELKKLSSSQYSNKAIHGLERIVSAESYYSKKLAIDKKYYNGIVDAYRQGITSAKQTDLTGNAEFNEELIKTYYAQTQITIGVLESMSGLAGMVYDATGSEWAFYAYRILAVAETIYYTVSAAKEAKEIGERVGGPYAGEVLGIIFAAIAVVVGLAKVASILATTPSTKSVPSQIYSKAELGDISAIIEESEDKRFWNPTIKWNVIGQQNSNMDFAREMLPYIAEAREDQVH